MRIGIDIHPLKNQSKHRGIGTYTKNLVEALKKYTREEIILIENENFPKIDLIHYPFFDLFNTTLPISKKYPTLVTVHDVIPLIFPSHYPPGIRGYLKNTVQRLSLKSVDGIITDSFSSREDIAKILKFPEDKIFPIYLAPGDNFKRISKASLSIIKKKYHLPEKFVVYVGSVNWNKNLLNLCEACIKAEADLCLVGKDFENKNNLNHPELKTYKEFIDKYSANPIIHILGFVSDDLANIINLSQMLLLPSFYEGFGLPILEAQACGTPVVTGNISSMPEVAGEGALLVDPNKSEEIAESIKQIMSDGNLRFGLISKGLKNVSRFSWEKTAEETVDVYRKILKLS